MSTDYHPIKANEIIRGQVLLDRGSERKIIGIHKLPGRIYVYIQKDTTKAQLQFSPLEEVSVRNDSAKKQIFPDTSSNTPQPKTQVENDGIAEPHFDSDHLTTLPLDQPELHDAAAIRLNNEHVMREVLRQQEESEARQLKEKGYVTGLFLEVHGNGTVTPVEKRIDAPAFSPSPSPSQLSREHQKYEDNPEDFVRVSDRREHNKTAIQVMKVGAAIIFIGVLLTAFGMADGSDGANVSWGVILAVIGGMIYTAGIFVAFFNPPYKRGDQVGELVEQLDTVRDLDWGIVVPALNLMSARTQAAPPPVVVVNPLPQTTSISSDKGYQDEVQTMAMQQGQKATSGTAPPAKEKTNAVSLTGEAKRIHDNDTGKQIDEALEQIDMMGAIEATKNSPRAEKRTEDDKEEQPTWPF